MFLGGCPCCGRGSASCQNPCAADAYAQQVANAFNPKDSNSLKAGDIYVGLKINGQYLVVSEISDSGSGLLAILTEDPNHPIASIADFQVELSNFYGTPGTEYEGCSRSTARFVSTLKEQNNIATPMADDVYISAPEISAEPVNTLASTYAGGPCYRSNTSSLIFGGKELNGGESVEPRLCFIEESAYTRLPGNFDDCGTKLLLSNSEVNNSEALKITYDYYRADFTTEQNCADRNNYNFIGSQTFDIWWPEMFSLPDCTQCWQCFRTFDIGGPDGYYQCFLTNDGDQELPPPDFGYTWEAVGDCYPTDSQCAANCCSSPPCTGKAETTTPLKGRTMPTTTTGPGTELSNLLKWFNIHAKEKGCGCKSMQKKMDRGGPQWCRDHKEEILAHLEKEAKKRKLPFTKLAASTLLNLAIRRSERG